MQASKPRPKKSTAPSVKTSRSYLTIIAVGDQNYYLGEKITFRGKTQPGAAVYLFLFGPSLPTEGANPVAPYPRQAPVVNNDAGTFVRVVANNQGSWTWVWQTYPGMVAAGTYTLYASPAPRDRNHLGIDFATVSIILKRPFFSATVHPYAFPVHPFITVTGVGGDTLPRTVAIWLIAGKHTRVITTPVNADGSYQFRLTRAALAGIPEGICYALVVNPGPDNAFDLRIIHGQINNRKLGRPPAGRNVLSLASLATLQGSDAAEMVASLFANPVVDDQIIRLALMIPGFSLRINPVHPVPAESPFPVSAVTDLPAGEKVTFEIFSSQFDPTGHSQSGSTSGMTSTVTVPSGPGFLHTMIMNVDGSLLTAGHYMVMATSVSHPATSDSRGITIL